jgi:hypothetical protein
MPSKAIVVQTLAKTLAETPVKILDGMDLVSRDIRHLELLKS